MSKEECDDNEWSEVPQKDPNPFLGMTIDQLTVYQRDLIHAPGRINPNKPDRLAAAQKNLDLVNTAIKMRLN